MYAHAMRVQKMAEAIEEQLKHAKSKEEADRIILSSLTGISKNDPDKEYIIEDGPCSKAGYLKNNWYKDGK